MRMRLRNSFRQIMACDLADPSDYMMLFGSMRGVPIPHGYGRGLVKVEGSILEFQGAALCPEGESEYDFIVSECEAMAEHSSVKAPSVPMPPETVSAELLAGVPVAEGTVPYGVYDDTLEAAVFDFNDVPLARCCFQKRKCGKDFLASFLPAAAANAEWDVVLLDMAGLLDEKPGDNVRAIRKDVPALAYLQSLAQGEVATGRTLVVATGIVAFLAKSDFTIASEVKEYLKDLRGGGEVSFLVVDAAADNNINYEDWFKTHLSNKEGLWVGPGIDSQSVINTVYNARFAKDNQMNETKGYAVEGGAPRLVHLVSAGGKEE